MTKVIFGGLYITGTPEDVQKAIELLNQYTSRDAMPLLPGCGDSQAEDEITLTWPNVGTVSFTTAKVNPDPKDVVLLAVSVPSTNLG